MTLPKGFCECGHKKGFHSYLDNKCTKCQCVKFDESKRNQYCDCGHQQSFHLENSNVCAQCNCFEFKVTPYRTSLDWRGKVKDGLVLAAVLAALGGLFAYMVWSYANCKFIGCPP